MRFPLHLLPCRVFLLNAAAFVDLALYVAVYGLASVELSRSLATLSHARRLEICYSTPSDFAAVSSRSGIGMFWTLLRVLSWVICASHGAYVVATVFWATLISVEEFPACPYFIWDISCVELERQILRLFSL